MDDKLKVFWNLDVLVKMCRSKSDGPSLRIEETEIEEKIASYTQEIEEIKTISEEDIYDTSAEMADRNIEIITKKHLQKLKNNLKEKNKELNKLKEREASLYEQTSLLRDNKSSQEKYITSMQERINESIDTEIIDRYNALIAQTSEKVSSLKDELEEQNSSYNEIQQTIIDLSEEIANIEEQIDKKNKLLLETQANLENKDNYIDKTKKEKNNKRIVDLENKIQNLNTRLETLRNDPKYIETKIKDVINNKDNIEDAKSYLINLINQVINVPYINVPADNTLEEELLRATQARDTFANEIDQKSYNILEANTPEKVRIDFLTKRISKWQNELEELKQRIDLVDKDKQFDYEKKNAILSNMIKVMKNDLKEFERAYEEAPEINIGAKASLKAALDEKKEDIIEAEKIATAFRKDEADDISEATRTLKYECEQLNTNIYNAEVEIANIKNRLMSKKSGLIDITSRNKDKDTLKELAQIVIDIKHRRGFPETPIEIVHRLEEELQISLVDDINTEKINETSKIEEKDYDAYLIRNNYEEIVEPAIISDPEEPIREPRGIRVIDEADIAAPNVDEDDSEESQASKDLQAAINEVIFSENKDLETAELQKNDELEEKIANELPNEEETLESTLENVEENNSTDEIEAPVYEQEELEKKETEEKAIPDDIEPLEENNDVEIVEEMPEEQLEKPLTEPIEPVIPENSEIIVPVVEESPVEQKSTLEQPTNTKEISAEQVTPTGNYEEPSITAESSEEQEEALDIGSIIEEVNKSNEEPEQNQTIELVPTAPKNDFSNDLTINSIFNNEKNNTSIANNDNIVTSENLASELDEFLNNLDEN